MQHGLPGWERNTVANDAALLQSKHARRRQRIVLVPMIVNAKATCAASLPVGSDNAKPQKEGPVRMPIPVTTL
eukprot:3524379-Amphidinium_carterae.2